VRGYSDPSGRSDLFYFRRDFNDGGSDPLRRLQHRPAPGWNRGRDDRFFLLPSRILIAINRLDFLCLSYISYNEYGLKILFNIIAENNEIPASHFEKIRDIHKQPQESGI
jgi:hypothetical protein